MDRRAILAVFAIALSGDARADWRVTDADPVALARVEVAQAKGADQPAFLEIACLRGTSPGAFILRAEIRVARGASGLPPQTTRQVRRLGRDCPGPIMVDVSVPKPGPLTMRIGGETVTTIVSRGAAFLRSEAVEIRSEPPCEIASHDLDPDEARLEIESRGETRIRYIAELLMAEHEGDVTVEAPEHGARQVFPVRGGAAAISDIRRICGWEDSSPRW